AASTTAPFAGTIALVPIEEPGGALRSWDVRADWRSSSPRCTAILDRPYPSADGFPAWYRNLIAAIRPGAPVDVRISGYVDVDRPGTLAIDAGEATRLTGTVGDVRVDAAPGAPATAAVPNGAHRVDLRATFVGDDWKLAPTWNGGDAWTRVRFTVDRGGALDRILSPLLASLTTLLVGALGGAWLWSCAIARWWNAPSLAWTAVAVLLFAACGATGRFERVAPLALVAAAWVPMAPRQRRTRAAFLLIGAPWLALFVARSWPLIGRVTMFTAGDDWQMYQAAAYRIVMNGYWIQGGTPTFLFQPLYRWIVGVLHLLFGDSSVGETYLDAFCLLAAALLVFVAVRRVCGYRWGVAAGALTLATFTISSIWYLIGRSLSAIAGLGLMVASASLLLRARRGSVATALAAAACATLMFYTRLNHLLVTVFLLVWLLPLRTPTAWRAVVRAASRVPPAPAVAYAAAIAAGVALFATRTWWYTGHFSVLYGTSFGVQQTGFQPSRMAEAIAAQLTMREPPGFDPRSMMLMAGAALAILAVLQVPWTNRLPAPLAIMTVGTIAGSFVAHTHEYPGRMSVHVVPFAVALTACAAARLTGRSGVIGHE